MSIRSRRAGLLFVLIAALTGVTAAQAPPSSAPSPSSASPSSASPSSASPSSAYTVVSREGRLPLPVRTINGQEMFAMDDLARLFNLTTKEDTIAGGLTITVRGQSILLSPNQEIASVAGRLISLPAPPAREGRVWFVPVDFVSRALAPIAGIPIELRKPSRLIITGDIRMPRVAGRIEPLGGLTRVTFDVAPTTRYVVAQEGNRLVVRFEADALDAALPSPATPDLIAAVRPEGPAAIVLEFGPRYASFRSSELPGDRGGIRIVIEIVGKTTDAPVATAPGAPAAEAPPLLDLVPAGTLRTVVIDPGHGGADQGARGAGGGIEKGVSLSVARRLKAALEGRLGVRVILTRDGDAGLGPDERAAAANNNKADIFISLHANASLRPAATGAQVFYLSLDEYGEDAQRAASAPRESLPVVGGGSRDIEVVAWRFAQARHIDRSATLARTIEASLRGRVTMNARPLQQAPLRVLVGANMPAVLVEMGFLSNPPQESQLASDTYQNNIVQGIVDAVIQFRDGRGVPAAPLAPVPQVPGR